MSDRRLISKPFLAVIGLAIGLSLLSVRGFAAGVQGAASPQNAKSTSVDATPPVVTVATNEWLTWGYDQERTLWNRAEKVLNKSNVGQIDAEVENPDTQCSERGSSLHLDGSLGRHREHTAGAK